MNKINTVTFYFLLLSTFDSRGSTVGGGSDISADIVDHIGSCAAAGYTACCTDGSDCLGYPANCKCDAECRDHGDCCTDIASTCPLTTSKFYHALLFSRSDILQL